MSRLLGIVLVLLAFLVPVEASRISRRALDGFGDTLVLQASLPQSSSATNSDAVVAKATASLADAGGNVTALVTANQQVVGRYLYDAYGGLIGMSGPMSEVNRYRFSSKEVDPTSGLYSFGYRFYAAEFQRWLNRDPIEEDGGINLFGYVGNDPVANVDPWGLVVLDDDGFPVDGSYNGLGAYRYDRDTKRQHDDIMAAAKARVRQMVDDAGSLLLGMINWEGKAASAVPKVMKALPKVCKAAKTTPKLLGPGTQFGAKIEGQLAKRGWTKDLVQSTIDKPTRTVPWSDTRHLRGGGRLNAPATAYYGQRGGYVVRNNRTGDIIQVSDRTDPGWEAPWD